MYVKIYIKHVTKMQPTQHSQYIIQNVMIIVHNVIHRIKYLIQFKIDIYLLRNMSSY